jgi:DNA-binding response OmpR family regulator
MDALRILIVDDEEELVSALEERLYLRGFQAKGVTTGEKALAHLANEPCDVVLLDVKMPGLGGLDVLKTIKEGTSSPQVILLTGHSSVQDAEKGMGLGAFDYLMKPIQIDELIGVLRSAGARKATGDPGKT